MLCPDGRMNPFNSALSCRTLFSLPRFFMYGCVQFRSLRSYCVGMPLLLAKDIRWTCGTIRLRTRQLFRHIWLGNPLLIMTEWPFGWSRTCEMQMTSRFLSSSLTTVPLPASKGGIMPSGCGSSALLLLVLMARSGWGWKCLLLSALVSTASLFIGLVCFAAEAIAVLRPRWHIILADIYVAPTSLFEVDDLLAMTHRLCFDPFFPLSRPVAIVGSEPCCDVNAGFVLFSADGSSGPSSFDGTMLESPVSPPSAFQPDEHGDPPLGRGESLPPDFAYRDHAAFASPKAALFATPLAALQASHPRDFLIAWAILGDWICRCVWPFSRDMADLAAH